MKIPIPQTVGEAKRSLRICSDLLSECRAQEGEAVRYVLVTLLSLAHVIRERFYECEEEGWQSVVEEALRVKTDVADVLRQRGCTEIQSL